IPRRIWSVPPAEPPATGTLVGSALRASAKSLALLNGEAAGTTSARYSPVKRAIGVVCESLTGVLLAMSAPTITIPATIKALSWPFHWLTNCGSPTAPPAPPTLVICTPHLLDGAGGLIPTAAGRRRHKQFQQCDLLRLRTTGVECSGEARGRGGS